MDWNMLNKITSLFLCVSLAYAPFCYADTPPPSLGLDFLANGKITGIVEGRRAPYSGVLLDNIAAAKIFIDRKYLEEEWNLRLQYELEKERARLNVIVESQKASLESLRDRHTLLMQIKDSEIERLSNIAVNKEDYSTWWAAGGLVAGIGLTLAVVFAVDAGIN